MDASTNVTTQLKAIVERSLDEFVMRYVNDGYILGPGIIKITKSLKSQVDAPSIWTPFGIAPLATIDECIPEGTQEVVMDILQCPQFPCVVRLCRGDPMLYCRHKFHQHLSEAIKAVGHIVMHPMSKHKLSLVLPGGLLGASSDQEITLTITSGRDLCVVVRDKLGKFVYGVLIDDAICF